MAAHWLKACIHSSQMCIHLGTLTVVLKSSCHMSILLPAGVFPNIQDGDKIWWWFVFDYLGDLIYLSDILFYKKRVLFMENGFWVKDRQVQYGYGAQFL